MENRSNTEEGEAARQFHVLVFYSLLLFFVAAVFLYLEHRASRGLFRASAWTIRGLDVCGWSFLWFGFSVSLVIYNKWLFDSWEGGFAFPFTVSMFHMVLKLVLSYSVVWYSKTRHQREIPKVSTWVWWCSAVPIGVTTALDIAASNASYLYVSVPFYTVVKSTSVVFVLLFSVLYRLQPCRTNLVLVTFVICAGVAMASYGEPEFEGLGFGLVLAASAVGGFRWALTQLLMMQIGSSMNSLMTIYTISPAAAVTLIPFALYIEGGELFSSKFVTDVHLLLLVLLNLIGSGLFAFAMIFVELALIQRTSSMSLSVISYVKQILQILLSILVFGDKLTGLNVFGMIVTMVGMAWYSKIKSRPSDREGYAIEEEEEEAFAPVSTSEEIPKSPEFVVDSISNGKPDMQGMYSTIENDSFMEEEGFTTTIRD